MRLRLTVRSRGEVASGRAARHAIRHTIALRLDRWSVHHYRTLCITNTMIYLPLRTYLTTLLRTSNHISYYLTLRFHLAGWSCQLLT